MWQYEKPDNLVDWWIESEKNSAKMFCFGSGMKQVLWIKSPMAKLANE